MRRTDSFGSQSEEGNAALMPTPHTNSEWNSEQKAEDRCIRSSIIPWERSMIIFTCSPLLHGELSSAIASSEQLLLRDSLGSEPSATPFSIAADTLMPALSRAGERNNYGKRFSAVNNRYDNAHPYDVLSANLSGLTRSPFAEQQRPLMMRDRQQRTLVWRTLFGIFRSSTR